MLKYTRYKTLRIKESQILILSKSITKWRKTLQTLLFTLKCFKFLSWAVFKNTNSLKYMDRFYDFAYDFAFIIYGPSVLSQNKFLSCNSAYVEPEIGKSDETATKQYIHRKQQKSN